MNEYSAECQAANRIAAQLRGGQPLKTEVSLNAKRTKSGRLVRAYATGIAGKGGYLRAAMEAKVSEVLAFCHQFYEANDQLPPQASVAEHFGVCEQVAQKYMRNVAEAGHLERNAVGKWRFARGRS